MSYPRSFAVSLLLFIASILSLDAVTFTVTPPVADAFVSSSTAQNALNTGTIADTNYGGAGAMQITASGNPKGQFQSVIRFNLATAVASFDSTFGAGGWFIDGVTLSLHTNFGLQGAQPNNPIFAPINAGLFEVRWMQSDAWAEGTGNPSNPTTDGITSNTLPNFLSANDQSLGTFSFTAPGNNTISTYALGLNTSFVTDATAGGDVSLHLLAADTSVSYLFNARSFGTATQKPQLTISAIPEPGTVGLLACATLVFISLCRRQRHALHE